MQPYVPLHQEVIRVIDPLTGGGIYNAMFTGDFSGKVAIDTIEKGDTSKAALTPYDTQWRESKMGKIIENRFHHS